MDFKSTAWEVARWGGAIVALGAIGVGIGYAKDYFSQLYAKKFDKPVEPFKNIKHVRPENYDMK